MIGTKIPAATAPVREYVSVSGIKAYHAPRSTQDRYRIFPRIKQVFNAILLQRIIIPNYTQILSDLTKYR